MTGGRPIPTNDPGTLMGFVSHLIWTMHHHVSLKAPKMGELVAYRNIGLRLSMEVGCDEDYIKMEIEKRGYISVYAPDAVVINRGPETIEDHLEQRMRVNIQEAGIRKRYGYSVPTWNKGLLLRALVFSMRDLGIKPVKMSIAALLEVRARHIAKVYVNAGKKDITIWNRVDSTKDVKKD
jgi:hypothetical protein